MEVDILRLEVPTDFSQYKVQEGTYTGCIIGVEKRDYPDGNGGFRETLVFTVEAEGEQLLYFCNLVLSKRSKLSLTLERLDYWPGPGGNINTENLIGLPVKFDVVNEIKNERAISKIMNLRKLPEEVVPRKQQKLASLVRKNKKNAESKSAS